MARQLLLYGLMKDLSQILTKEIFFLVDNLILWYAIRGQSVPFDRLNLQSAWKGWNRLSTASASTLEGSNSEQIKIVSLFSS